MALATDIHVTTSADSAEVEPKRHWHPTRQEREGIASMIVSGMSVDDVAARMGKSREQIRYQLDNKDTRDAILTERERASDSVGFALAQLQIALPQSAQNLINIAADPGHKDHFNALRFHLETCLASRLKQPEQQVNMTLNITNQAAALVSAQLPKMFEARGETRVEHPSNNRHLKFGEEVSEERQARID